MPRLDDHDAVIHAHDPHCLPEDDLDLPGVAAPTGGVGHGLGARLDRGEVDERALRLRDDLLGHHHDVIRAQGERARGSLERVADEAGQVVSGMDLGDAVEREDLQAGWSRDAVAHGRSTDASPRPAVSAASRSSGVSRSRRSGPESSR